MKTLEASKAVADLARILKDVDAMRVSFKIVRKGVPFAYLVPAAEHCTDSHEWADTLAATRLDLADRRAMSRHLRKGRKVLKPLKNPWA